MTIDLIKKCEEIQTKTNELQELRAILLSCKNYNQLTTEEKNLLAQKSRELGALKSQTFPLYLDTFVQEISKIWNVPQSALITTIDFDQGSELPIRCSKKEYINYVKGLGGLSITFNVHERGPRFAKLVTELNLNAKQKNGKKLEELVDVVSVGDFLNLFPGETRLKLNDYKNLIFIYSLEEIYEVLQHSLKTSSDVTKAFLSSIEQYNEEQEEMEQNA